MQKIRAELKHLGVLGLVVLMIGLGGYLSGLLRLKTQSAVETSTGFADPAAVYCTEMGYKYRIVKGLDGEIGTCIFPDGRRCEAWDFLNGACGAAYSYCARNGMVQEVRQDGGVYAQDYTVCVDGGGAVVNSVVELAKLEKHATEGCGTQDPAQQQVSGGQPYQATVTTLPTFFDWRSVDGKNWLPAVRSQGICGSCWAQSAVGVLETQLNFVNNLPGDTFNFSEEYLVSDCFSGSTCCGGFKDQALGYLKSTGIPNESCMSYVDETGCRCNLTTGTCSTDCSYRTDGKCSDQTCSDRCATWSPGSVRINQYGKVTGRAAIKQALINKGPLAASLRMSGTFDAGIYKCTTDTPTNHAVVLVGYQDSINAWIVRNSWGPDWNGAGYFKVGYGECSIESKVYYGSISDLDYPFTLLSHSTVGWVPRKGAWKLNNTWSSYQSGGIPWGSGSVSYRGIFSNGEFKARMKRTGDCTGCANALLIRGNPMSVSSDGYWHEYYAFQYTNDGYFSVWKRVSGVSTALVGWTYHSSIVKNGWNTLKVVSSNGSPSTMNFYINGSLVASVTDNSLHRGRIGFRFYREDTAGTLIIDSTSFTLPEFPVGAVFAPLPDQIIPGLPQEGGTEMMYP